MRRGGSFANRKGSTYIIIVGVFLVVSLLAMLSLQMLGQSVFQTHGRALELQAYYYNREAADAMTAALLKDSGTTEHTLLQSVAALEDGGSYTPGDDDVTTLNHTADGSSRSSIVLKKEIHEYFEENREWAVAEITTTIPDVRASRQGEDFTYMGTLLVLIDDPTVQLYNVKPEDAEA